MTRTDYRPWASVALLGAVLGYVGCSTNPPTPALPPAEPTKTAVEKRAEPAQVPEATILSRSKPQNILDSLGKPAAILVVTGQQDGYMEPCGCSEDQEGGLIRRYDLLERIHKRNWPTVQIDLGSLIKDPAGARGGFEQARIKFDYAIKALRLLNYSALALCADDLKVGADEAMGLFDNGLGDSTKIVVANVEPDKVYEKLVRPSLVATAGPVKLGITAVIDPDTLQKINDPNKNALFPIVKAPDLVLPKVLTDLEGKSDYQVLMVQGPPELALSLAKAHPGFDIVVSTSHSDDVLNPEPVMENDGKTMVVTVGKKGKSVGLISFFPDESPRLRFRLVILNKYFDDPAAPMKALIQDEYRGTLKAADVVGSFVRRGYAGGAPGATFVGAAACKECHPKTYEFWATTKHANAFETLKHDKKPNTNFDAECVSCHTTGFEYNSGFKSEGATGYLAGNQCENCHGPGSKHAAEPTDAKLKKLITVRADQAKTNGLCLSCHDAENSPKFDFAKYWDEIEHNALDEYGDPKVRRGKAPVSVQGGPSEKTQQE